VVEGQEDLAVGAAETEDIIMTRRIREIVLSVCLAAGIVLATTALVVLLARALVLLRALHHSVFGADGVGFGLASFVAGLVVLSACQAALRRFGSGTPFSCAAAPGGKDERRTSLVDGSDSCMSGRMRSRMR
jgi:hypothetical protein